MKKTILMSAILAGSLAWNASAQEFDYVGATPRVLAEANAQAADLPAGVLLVELERWKNREDTFSARPITHAGSRHPGTRQGVLGFVSYYPFEGSVTIYACLQNNWLDSFSSRDPNCEGHMKTTNGMPVTGYIAATQLPGTVPLYRCHRGGLKPNNWADLFDTTDFNCENVKYPLLDQVLGYIWL